MDLRINLIPVVSDTQVVLRNIEDLNLTNVSNPEKVVSGYITGSRGFQVSPDDVVLSNLSGLPLFGDDGYPGILSRVLSDSDGNVNFSVRFQLVGTLPKYIYIGFDSIVREYASEFSVTNDTTGDTMYISGNTRTFVHLNIATISSPRSSIFTLNITKWSKPNASIRLTTISVTPTIRLTTRDIKSASWSENKLDDNMELVPGVCEQYADIEFYDRDGVATFLAREDALIDKYKIELVIDDVVENTYITQDWDVDTSNSIFTLRGTDYYYLFSKVKVEAQVVKDRSLVEMIRWIFGVVGVPFRLKNFSSGELITPNSWFYTSTVGEILEKICNAFALRIYWLNDKYVVEELWPGWTT